jgi:hypothetical protein
VLDRLAILRHPELGDLEDRGRGVHSGEIVLAQALVSGALTHVDRVERGAEIDEERVVARSHEHLRAVTQGPDGLLGELGVVGERLRPDIGRCDRQVPRDSLLAGDLAVPQDLSGEVVPLHDVQAGIAEILRPRIRIEEGVRVPRLGLELELVPEIGNPVAGVVDVDVVLRPVVEPEEVRPVGRYLTRDPVRRDRQRLRRVVGRVRVHVRVVRGWIQGDIRRLAVARAEPERDRDRRGGNRHDHDREASVLAFAHLPGTPF